MKVRINKCSKSIWWYNSKIGCIFDVVTKLQYPEDYRTTNPFDPLSPGTFGYILKTDCTILSDEMVISDTGEFSFMEIK